MKFEDDMKNGGYGEHAVWNLLMNQSWVRSVVDVRSDKNFQEKDIDFLVEDVKRQFTPIEVKTDYKAQDTGNLVYEVTTSGHIGCFEKTQAKYIAYFIPGNETVHLVDTVALRTYIHKVRPEVKRMGDNSQGFLIPISELINDGVIKKTYKGVI